MKKYIELQNKTINATHLRVDIDYNIGQYNYFTHQNERRGYYISVSPVAYSNNNGIITESYAAFTGVKYLLKEVTRKSTKAEKEAESIAAQIEKNLIEYVCNKNNLSIMEDGTK